MNYPGIGGRLAEVTDYSCAGCGEQIISSVPVERCESCRSSLSRVRLAADALEKARAEERKHRERLTAAIVEARAAGHSLAEIGEVLGLTRQRVAQLSQ